MIVTPCGALPNDADCMMCLRMQDCREARAAICQGCVREQSGICPASYKQKCAELGCCRGRELSTQMRTGG